MRLAVALAAAVLAAPAFAQQESYTLDPFHTYPHFAADHLGYSTMWGRFDKSSGKFTMDRSAKSGTFDLVVETASLTTGDNEKGNRPRARDEHLRSADFFNVTEFPRMTFKGNGVKWTGEYPSAIEGQVTLLGVSKPVTLTFDRFKCGPHPVNKREMCGGNASGTIKRSDFGMKFGIPAVGDEIRLFVEFEGYKD